MGKTEHYFSYAPITLKAIDVEEMKRAAECQYAPGGDLSQLLKPMKDAGMKSLKGRAADGSLPIVREFLATLGIYDLRPAQQKFNDDIDKMCRNPTRIPASIEAWVNAPRDMTEMG